MQITHNYINNLIDELDKVVKKGQSITQINAIAKSNRYREIRRIIRNMHLAQEQAPMLKEVWFYFWKWIKYRTSRIFHRIYDRLRNLLLVKI